MSAYAQMIREDMAKLGMVGQYDPSHVEAWMRLEHPTLDALSRPQFRREVEIAMDAIDGSELDFSRRLAESYGLACE